MFYAVRGAVTVSANQPQLIQEAVRELIETLLNYNKIEVAQIVDVFFTSTPDLTTLNPAKAIRECRPDWQHVPMLCSQEPMMEDTLPLCIRVLIQWESSETIKRRYPVYLGDAKQLRPDL
jgi:chorismate mutase